MRGWGAGLGALLVLLVSCARAPAAVQPTPGGARTPPATGAEPTPAGRAGAPAVTALPLPPSFRSAVQRGTRTDSGVPGPAYWQQRVDYHIEAELDPRQALLSGQEEVRYVNASPDTLTGLVLHLYQNLFRPGAPRDEATPTTGGLVLERVVVDGRTAREAREGPTARPFYQVDNTVMGIALPRPLLPGDTTRLQLAWHFTVPPGGAPRMGHEGRQLFLVAQWYPKLAVYDDVNGWDTHPYLGTGEFYEEYGDYEVALTLPEGYLVGATGTLQNPDEVLTATERARLELALRVDTVVHVVRADEQRPGTITQQAPGGSLTWQFQARRVRDFAFAASNRYLWDATHADTPDPAGGAQPRGVLINAFYRAGARAWREAAAYTRHAIAYHAAQWAPYLYPQMTSAEGPEEGMEYPMLVFVSAYADPGELLGVITHEVGHQWFPMMVGSDEHEFAWQDEGLDTYIENLATLDYAPGTDVWSDDLTAYLGIAGSEDEVPSMRPADLFGNEQAYGVASYMKPALALRALGAVIGGAGVRAGLRRYAASWRLKHPRALDFFNSMNAAAGRDLDWFWYPWFYTTEVLDQAVAGVKQRPAAGGDSATVTIENRGQVPMPVSLRLTLAGGATRDVTVPADVWFDGARYHAVQLALPATLERVTIDPDGLLPDVDRANNQWPR